MKLSKDEQKLLEIKEIKDLESIELKDLFQHITNGKRTIVPGFIITYGEPLKMMYKTTLDKYFDDFIKRVKEVYQEEKDHVIRTGILGDEYIQIDPLSKTILLNGDLDIKERTYDHYKRIEGYDESLLFEEDKFKSYLPIIKYQLTETLKTMGLTISNIVLSHGNNGIYYLKGTINNDPIIIPINFEEHSNTIKVTISNVLHDSIPIVIEASVTNKGINIICRVDEFTYYDYTSFEVRNNKVSKNREVIFQHRPMHLENEDLKLVEDQTIPDKWASIEDEKDVSWYQLPFDSYIGFKRERKSIAEDGTLLDEDGEHILEKEETIVVIPSEETVLSKDFMTKVYYKKIDDRTISQKVTLDTMDKTTIALINKDHALLETSFGEDGVSGIYKKYLEGKHFYQKCNINDIKSTLSSLERKDGIEEKTDLLDESIYRKR